MPDPKPSDAPESSLPEHSSPEDSLVYSSVSELPLWCSLENVFINCPRWSLHLHRLCWYLLYDWINDAYTFLYLLLGYLQCLAMTLLMVYKILSVIILLLYHSIILALSSTKPPGPIIIVHLKHLMMMSSSWSISIDPWAFAKCWLGLQALALLCFKTSLLQCPPPTPLPKHFIDH